MSFVSYKYGCWRKEIRQLLKKRLSIKEKIRYHKIKTAKYENEELPRTEKELDSFLKKAGN